MSVGDEQQGGAPARAARPATETPPEVVAALLLLTFTTGVIDAVSLLGLGPVFVANQTGNVLLLGFAIAGASGFTVVATLISLAGFLAGVAAGGLIGRGRAAGRTGWMTLALGVEVGLLGAAALLAIGVDLGDGEEVRRYAAIALLGAAMGFRNAAVRDLEVKDMTTTTVVSMTMTGLLEDSEREGPGGPNLVRRGGAVVSMLVGAVVGALLTLHADTAIPLAVAVACVGVSLALVLRARGRPAPRG